MDISIPFGAIKRFAAVSANPALELFQFLLVRLRESVISSMSSRSNISIPFGAIKSLAYT